MDRQEYQYLSQWPCWRLDELGPLTQMKRWSIETDVQLKRLRWRKISVFLKTMRHCSWTKICTSLWRFGLQPSNFFHFPPQGSEDPILVKLASMAEKPKLHKENLLSYDFSNTRLHPSNRNFASLYKLAILQPKHFSHSRALQLHSATRLRYHKHHVRATRSSRKSDNFPNACGFRWWCEIWVSHQSGSLLS